MDEQGGEEQVGGEPPEPGLSERLQEGRETFQPALWGRIVAGGLVAVYALLFVVLNTHRVKVSFVFASTRVSLIWVILLSLVVGIVLGVLASQLRRHRDRRR
jgi:uncharacterized integral membrane protein